MPEKKSASNADLMNRLLSAHEHIGALREEASTAKFQLSEERAKNCKVKNDLEYWKSHALDALDAMRHAKEQATEQEKFQATIARMICERIGYEKVSFNRIGAIREVRAEAEIVGLKEAKNLVDNWLSSKGWVNPYVGMLPLRKPFRSSWQRTMDNGQGPKGST